MLQSDGVQLTNIVHAMSLIDILIVIVIDQRHHTALQPVPLRTWFHQKALRYVLCKSPFLTVTEKFTELKSKSVMVQKITDVKICKTKKLTDHFKGVKGVSVVSFLQ